MSSAELFNPTTGSFSNAGSLGQPMEGGASVLLRDRRVLVLDGDSRDAETYDASTDRFTKAGRQLTRHLDGRAAPLLDGRVLVMGGVSEDFHETASAEIFDPAGATFPATDSMAEALDSGDRCDDLLWGRGL